VGEALILRQPAVPPDRKRGWGRHQVIATQLAGEFSRLRKALTGHGVVRALGLRARGCCLPFTSFFRSYTMNRRTLIAAALSLGLAVFTIPVSVRGAAPFSEIVVFGDSLSDTGNLFLASGGVVAGPPYFEGRFSNGPVWVEVMAAELGLQAPLPSLVGGTNYAWGGAETGSGHSSFDTPNVGMQIDLFLADRGGFTGDELIVVAAGSNDLLWQAPYGPGEIVESLRKHIGDLAGAGGKTFLVANSPAGGSMAAKFNELLAEELDRLEDKLGVTIIPFDMAGVWQFVQFHPADFGLTNVTDPACPGCGIGIPDPDAIDTLVPNPDEYFLWDLIHPTRVVHAAIGQAAAEVVCAE
jgi:phospholipase/lecithinase/hemolysin